MKKKLGEIMIDSGLITIPELQQALELQKRRKIPLGKALMEMNLVTENQISEALSKQIGFPYINLINYPLQSEVLNLIPIKLIQKYCILPVALKDNLLVVATGEPENIEGLDAVRQFTKRELEVYYAPEEDIQFIINRFSSQKQLQENATTLKKNNFQPEASVAETINIAADVPVVKFLNSLLSSAFKDRASDIHIEPGEKDLRIRLRIDGALYEIMKNLSLGFHASIVSRIKVMANLDIAEKRIPQDGRIPVEIDGKKADLRVSIIPSNFGEKVVLRILHRQLQYVSMEGIGFQDQDLAQVREMLTYPYGMILVSGPTGSGKTTTLYAFLQQLNTLHKNLITLEDPIEYIISGITQVNVNPKTGLTFASGLRAFLRQDPDVIMVGETRGEETARITVQASLTGHLVLSTIHTNDAVGVITRLLNMNLEPYLITSALVGVVAQRLVRKICPRCKTSRELPEEYLKHKKLSANLPYYYGQGCEYCKNTGFSGRTSIYEILQINDELREAVIGGASQGVIQNIALTAGMRLLFDSGLELVKKGVTTIDEVLRVTAFK